MIIKMCCLPAGAGIPTACVGARARVHRPVDWHHRHVHRHRGAVRRLQHGAYMDPSRLPRLCLR